MIVLLLLACSSGKVSDPEEIALKPLLVRLDADGDGSVTATDHALLARDGPAFDTLDQDGNGTLGVEELAVYFQETNPVIPNPSAGKKGKGKDGAGKDGAGKDGAGKGGMSGDGAARPGEGAVKAGDATARKAGGPGKPGDATAKPGDATAKQADREDAVQPPLGNNVPTVHRVLRDAFNLLEAETHRLSPDTPLPQNAEIREAVLTSDIRSETSQALLRRYAAVWETAGVPFPAGLIVEKAAETGGETGAEKGSGKGAE